MNIVIVGATGNVGRKTLEVLEKKELSIDNLYLVASSKSAGKKISFKGKEHEIFDLENFDFSKVKIAFFAAGGKISEKYAGQAAKYCIVIDNSSFYRMDSTVPLVVPQVNSNDLKNIKKNIIANPNCSTAQLVLALKPLHDLFTIKRIVVSTYQSVSGAGKAPMDELIEQTKQVLAGQDVKSKNFTKQIAFNAIPHIDAFSDDGYTKEELKMTNETKKILDESIELTATCVRVPVFVSHSLAVNLEFEKPYEEDQVREIFKSAPGLKMIDYRADEGYVTPVESAGLDPVYVSRIRRDPTIPNGLNFWCVSDNLRKGAALNTVQIAELLIKDYLSS